MIDLHSHILPGVDDGSSDLEMSIEMAQLAVADGTRVLACTPHVTPSVYENSTEQIKRDVSRLQSELKARQIPLILVPGADFHVSGDMLIRLQDGTVPCLASSRYFLFEPPHHVMPPKLVEFAKSIIDAGFLPILTHPERLTWIENHYDAICALHKAGAVVQLTAASIEGGFGKRPRYWSERMLDEGRVDIIASDAHHPTRRPPGLSRARDNVAARCGDDAATKMVNVNPLHILKNEAIKRSAVVETNPPSVNKTGILEKLRLRPKSRN